MKTKYLSPTEEINKNTADLGCLPVSAMIAKMYEESLRGAASVISAAPAIEAAINAAAQAYQKGAKIIFCGAGTSGRLGVLEAAECPPTFSVSPNAFTALIAGGKKAVFRPAEGAEDDREQGARDFLKASGKRDLLIAVAASGNTPYVQGALKAAKSKKNKTVLISCNDKADTKFADIFIYLPTGAEVISGSTRLNAATATKIALNMITTLAMVRCGKVYKNYMVDVKASNDKLKSRAVRLIRAVAGTTAKKALSLARETRYNVKAAIVMAKQRKTKSQAEALLKKHKGFLERIIDD